MNVLENLEPKEVFHYFEEITRIPRPSGHEKQISDYLADFAKKRNLEYYQDEIGNIIIIKEAAKDYENVEPLILQGHMDMVCEKEKDCDIDFEREPLELELNGDFISAKGTTLGGDDGIAVAYALAILASDTIRAPRIEFVCTVSEEVGMEGATAIDVSMLKGHRLLNLDSEEEGKMLVSCAGGCRATCVLPAQWEETLGHLVTVHVSGLLGGHSGSEIHKGRANANVALGRILLGLWRDFPFQIHSISGGSKDNAIPRESTAVLVVKEHTEELVQKALNDAQEIRKEFASADPNLQVEVSVGRGQSVKALTEDMTKRAVFLITLLPNGILRMSDDIEGLVETSLNLGIMLLEDGKLTLHYAVRSSVGTAKEYLLEKMTILTEEMGGSLRRSGEYPAWEYRRESKLRDDMIRIFRKMYGHDPEVYAIHAGVECGILAGKIPDLDAVSIGPDMTAVHTTDEKLCVSSVKRVWEYLIQVLACR